MNFLTWLNKLPGRIVLWVYGLITKKKHWGFRIVGIAYSAIATFMYGVLSGSPLAVILSVTMVLYASYSYEEWRK